MKKKIIFSLYYVSVAKNGVFVHKHLRFWNKRKIPPKDSHFSARNPHEYSKLFFISVMLWKAKKKYLKKKLETREFFFLVQKKIQWEKVSKMKRFAPLLYHHPPSVAQFFDYFRVYSIFSHCSTHTEKKNHPYPKIRPPEKWKKVYYYKTIVFDWVFITRCVKLKVNNTKILERRKNGNFHY